MRVLIFVLLAMTALAADKKYQCVRDILELGDATNGDLIDVRGDYDVKALLAFQHEEKVKTCILNLEPAKKRCEGIYGEGRCEQISPSAYQTKCQQYFHRTGCCHCTMKCPEGWTEENYHCVKPEVKHPKIFDRKDECEEATKRDCIDLGQKWSAECGHNYQRLGASLCVPICPLGWHDEGARCRKPANYRMAQPFFWQQGDN